MNLENVSIENAKIIADKGMECFDVNTISLKNVYFEVKENQLMTIINGKNMVLDEVTLGDGSGSDVSISGPFTENIVFQTSGIEEGKITISKSVKEGAVSFK